MLCAPEGKPPTQQADANTVTYYTQLLKLELQQNDYSKSIIKSLKIYPDTYSIVLLNSSLQKNKTQVIDLTW